MNEASFRTQDPETRHFTVRSTLKPRCLLLLQPVPNLPNVLQNTKRLLKYEYVALRVASDVNHARKSGH